MKRFSESYMRLYATSKVVGGHKAVQADPEGIWGTEHGYVPLDQLPKGHEHAQELEAMPKQSSEEAAPEPEVDADTLPEWTHRFSPEAYLRRWPSGPHADLARRALEG